MGGLGSSISSIYNSVPWCLIDFLFKLLNVYFNCLYYVMHFSHSSFQALKVLFKFFKHLVLCFVRCTVSFIIWTSCFSVDLCWTWLHTRVVLYTMCEISRTKVIPMLCLWIIIAHFLEFPFSVLGKVFQFTQFNHHIIHNMKLKVSWCN